VAVEIKSPKEIELMRTVCRLAAETLLWVGDKLAPGMTTADIDKIVHDHTLSQGARPAPLNYKGFPKSVCTSVNEIVWHGAAQRRHRERGRHARLRRVPW
jgi:methionyl aminopeptidase